MQITLDCSQFDSLDYTVALWHCGAIFFKLVIRQHISKSGSRVHRLLSIFVEFSFSLAIQYFAFVLSPHRGGGGPTCSFLLHHYEEEEEKNNHAG